MAKKPVKKTTKKTVKKTPRRTAEGRDNGSASPRELVVIVHAEAGLRASAGRFASLANESVGGLESVLKKHKASMAPLFGKTEERLIAEMNRSAASVEGPMDNLSTFYKVDTDEATMDELAEELAEQDFVACAYVKPGAEPPALNDEAAAPEEAPPTTSDFSDRQGYLDAAPEGVNARWAWGRAGGRGQNVRIIDIEGAWRFTHEDLTQNQGGVVGGTESTNLVWRNHGTAVLGEYSGDHNGFGISGICDQATASAISIFGGVGSAQAIRNAAMRLRAGDIILIELHRPGPRFNFQQRDDQRGYIAIEWWEDDFAAIRFATQRGVIVIEAAGNGAENLDDAIYSQRPATFPSTWTNPFNRTNRDCGAVVVGAGAPPPGTHGRDHGPDRSRLGFSNYGALVDAQGWGREVTTCGYGGLQGGSDEDLWYTDTFSGTSSASPIVVGAVGSIQGMARARSVPVLTPARVRQCLRTTGSPQQDAPGRPSTQRIGNRPDIQALVTCAFGGVKRKENLKDSIKDFLKDNTKEHEKVKERKETKEFKEKEKEKDRKEFKEKDRKELKDKDKDKDRFEKQFEKRFDKQSEKQQEKQLEKRFEKSRDFVRPGADMDVDDRIAAIEEALGQLTHFITTELRPDLAAGAREYGADGSEEDYEAEAKDAKDGKDMKDKDSENL